MENLKCSICDSPFALEEEGGIHGFFGICEVAFCVWCYASITDMVEKGCLRCQEDLKAERFKDFLKQEILDLEEKAPDKDPYR